MRSGRLWVGCKKAPPPPEAMCPVGMDLGVLPAAVDFLGSTKDDPVTGLHMVEGDTGEIPQLSFVDVGPELDVDAPEPPAVR
jgi:hypothetical protein